MIHVVRNVYTNHNKCDSVFHEQCGRTSLSIKYQVSWKYLKLILHSIGFLFIRIVQNECTRISGQHRVCFDFHFFLSGSWRKWPLFGVSLCTLYCQIIITRQFLFEYMLLNSSVTELFHFRYYVGCFPYTRLDLEINKCVGKLHFFLLSCAIYLYMSSFMTYTFLKTRINHFLITC